MRPKLTYANVVATLALFIAIGGAGAFAASQLGKNSVGSKQLKKNSVTTAKIKKGAVTGAKVKISSLGTVPSAAHAANADQLGDQPASSYARTQLEPVHYVGALGEPNFEPGCENLDPAKNEAIGFYRDPFGIVHLVGSGKNCIGAVFTLPSAFRPAKAQTFTNKSEEILVNATGLVVCYGTPVPELDGMTFRTG